MKFEQLKNKDNLLIDLDEQELAIILKALEMYPNLNMLFDMDKVMLAYYRALEKNKSA